MKRLDHQTALVTGGTSGIGRAIVERFVAEGARVFFTGRRAELGAHVARATGAAYIEADAASEADTVRAVALAGAEGRIDVLVNNAGGCFAPGRLEALRLEAFDAAMAVMVRGALAHIKHVGPGMRARRQGSIINIASIAGQRVGYINSVVYEAAKAALLQVTRHAAMELGEDLVRVNAISPGGIATGIFGKGLGLASAAAEASSETVAGYLATKQALPRAGLPGDIANAAVFLASEESSFINGADLVVDGGLIWGRRYSEMAADSLELQKLLAGPGSGAPAVLPPT